jgi:ABC-type Zn2+ transport system substrate-binding protein/surface adhesin
MSKAPAPLGMKTPATDKALEPVKSPVDEEEGDKVDEDHDDDEDCDDDDEDDEEDEEEEEEKVHPRTDNTMKLEHSRSSAATASAVSNRLQSPNMKTEVLDGYVTETVGRLT